jgi:SEC-C motif-containing protein
MIELNSPCPCGSNNPFSACCKLVIDNRLAETAEQLMRSRYTAYVIKDIAYLVETTHPKKRSKSLGKDIESWIHLPTWEKLKVHHTHMGTVDDIVGKVEFSAYYNLKGEAKMMTELSRFKKFKNAWYYFDAK